MYVFNWHLEKEVTQLGKKSLYFIGATWPDIKIDEAVLFIFWAKSKDCFITFVLNDEATDPVAEELGETRFYTSKFSS